MTRHGRLSARVPPGRDTMAYWMITNRVVKGTGAKRSLGIDEGGLRYWTAETGADVRSLADWTERSEQVFRERLIRAAQKFPRIDNPAQHEDQKHVTLFIHGFNNSWQDSAKRYQQISDSMYAGAGGLGECVLFSWPSDGLKTAYYPDRLEARRTADDLATVLSAIRLPTADCEQTGC